MSEFQFGNGNKFDISHLRAGITVDENNIFLKKYDRDNNSIFDAAEINQLKSDLEKYSGGDKVLDEQESISFFASVMNMSVSSVKQLFAKNNNAVYSSFETLYTAQAYENAAENIRANAQMGIQIFHKAQGGAISKTWNSIKEFWNTEYAGDKVYRQLADNMTSGLLLEKAQREGGISKKEYIETKIEFLKILLGGETLQQDEIAMIEKAVSQMTVKELDVLITTLRDAESDDYKNIVNNTMKDLAQKAFTGNDGVGFTVMNPNSIGAILGSEQAEEKLTYENVFLLENGVEFNAEMVNRYAELERKVKIAVTINNRVASLYNELDEPVKELEELNSKNKSPEEKDNAYNNLSSKVIGVLEDLFGTRAEEKLKEYGYNDAVIKDGVINFGEGERNYSALVDLAKNLQADLKSKVQTTIDGKHIEECERELKTLYAAAYGDKNSVDLAEKFQSSQEAGVGYAKALAATAGIVPCIISGGSLIPIIVGSAVGAFAPAAVSYAEASTKDGGLTPEDRTAIKQEILMGLALTAAGGGAGAVSSAVGKEVLKQCPNLIAKISQGGMDAVMGCITDLAITGDIDLQGEGIAQLINILTGITAAKKARVKTHYDNDASAVKQNKFSYSDLFARDLSKTEVDSYITALARKRGSNLDSAKLQKISDALYKMKKDNSPLYQDIQNSGILKLVEEGKIDFDVLEDLCIDAASNTRMSASLLEDCKKMSSGEPAIRGYSSGTDLNQVFKSTQTGEVVEVGSQLYVNDGKSMTKVNLTKEKYLELFPPFKRFDINQNDNKNAGNCWYLETMHNLYQNPTTRVKILQLFRQEGNDVYIKLPNSKYEYKFQNGDVPKDSHDKKFTLSDSPKWVNMLEYVGAMTRKKNGVSVEDNLNPEVLRREGVLSQAANGNPVIDMSSFMYVRRSESASGSGLLSHLYAGTPEEALQMLTGNNVETKKYYIDNTDSYYGVKHSKDKTKLRKEQHKEIKEILQNLDGKSGYVVNIGFGGHAFAVTKVENGKVCVQDPYNTKIESIYTIDELAKLCDYIEFSRIN